MNLKIAHQIPMPYIPIAHHKMSTMDESEFGIQVLDMLWCASAWYSVPIEINVNCALRSHRAKRKHTHTYTHAHTKIHHELAGMFVNKMNDVADIKVHNIPFAIGKHKPEIEKSESHTYLEIEMSKRNIQRIHETRIERRRWDKQKNTPTTTIIKEEKTNQCSASTFVWSKCFQHWFFPPDDFFPRYSRAWWFVLFYFFFVFFFSFHWHERTNFMQTEYEYEYDREFIIEIMLIIWFNLRSSYYYFSIRLLLRSVTTCIWEKQKKIIHICWAHIDTT